MTEDRRFIVHIGRQKTGTTAIQEFLLANRQALDEHLGCYVPLSGTRPRGGHYHFGLGLMNIHKRMVESRDAEIARWQEYADPSFRREYIGLTEEISDKGSYILLSNEGFQNANIHLMANLFPPAQTQIVVYLREQLDYLISAYAQAVHARKLATPFCTWNGLQHADYAKFIARFTRRYNARDLHIRIYDRHRLDGGDVVKDFLSVLDRITQAGAEPDGSPAGIRQHPDQPSDTLGTDRRHRSQRSSPKVGPTWKYPPRDPNPSIGGVLLEFKRVVNMITDLSEVELRRRLYKPLSELASKHPRLRRKPYLDRDTCHRVRTTYEASNRVLFQRYVDELDDFEMLDFTRMGPEDDAAKRDDLDLIWESLNETDDAFVQAHYERYQQYAAAAHNG